MLTYTKTTHRSVEETHTYELRVPTEWGMFTKAGDRAITTKANNLVKKLEKATSHLRKYSVLYAFLRSVRSMARSNSYREVDDTDVRDAVWGFFANACLAVNIDRDKADKMWDDLQGYPKEQ
jgi:hypothetical protein